MSGFQPKTYDLHGRSEEQAVGEILSILFELRSSDYFPYNIKIITGKGDGVMQNTLFDIIDDYDDLRCEQINDGKYEIFLEGEKE